MTEQGKGSEVGEMDRTSRTQIQYSNTITEHGCAEMRVLDKVI